MNIIAIIISLVSGAVGGNVAGALLKRFSLGTLGNSIAGILGGGVGGTIFAALGMGAATPGTAAGGMDVMSIVGSILTGGVGGGLLMAIIGMIKSAVAKPHA